MKVISVGLVGITGYAGMELARLLAGHPSMRLGMACSRAEARRRLGSYYPFLEHLPGADVVISTFDPQKAAELCEVVFLAVPAGKFVDKVGNHIQHLRHRVLVLDVHQLGHPILDHQHRAGAHLRAHASGPAVLGGLGKCPGGHAAGHVH